MAISAIRRRAGYVCAKSSLTLAMCLALTVPFGPGRNIDAQGLLLIVLGGLAWLSVLLHRRAFPSRLVTALTGLFLLACLLATLVNSHAGYNLLGAPFVRLGLLGFVSCAGFGYLLFAWRMSNEKVIKYLYGLIAVACSLSVPYVLMRGGSVGRIGGIFAQADIFAVIAGCGLLLGGYLLQKSDNKRLLIIAQLVLTLLLILSGTRAVAGLVLVLYPLGQWLGPRPWQRKQLSIYILAILALYGFGYGILPARYHNLGYAAKSISYRISLQSAALDASWQKPLTGYGPGNLADSLACPKLHDKALQQTCHEGYFFNSSHNIFLDRVLAVGWLGGLAYASLILLAIWRGFRSDMATKILALCTLLIAIYYLTNVTSVVLELLLWALAARCYYGFSTYKKK